MLFSFRLLSLVYSVPNFLLDNCSWQKEKGMLSTGVYIRVVTFLGHALRSAGTVSKVTADRHGERMAKDEYLTWILVPVTFLMMLAYNVNLYFRFKRNPMGTVMGVNLRAGRAWVRTMMTDNDKKNILAVQTLRNSIMGSTLLATTAIFLSTGVLAFLATTYSRDDQSPEITSPFNVMQSLSYPIMKHLFLLMGFFFAFLCYVQSIRYINDVNFLINIPLEGQFNPDYTADVLEKGAHFYTMGTRVFYVAIPLLLWLFGTLPFFFSTLFFIPVWFWLDTVKNSTATFTSERCLQSCAVES